MDDARGNRPMARRTVLRGMAAGAVGVVGASRIGLGNSQSAPARTGRVSSSRAVRVEVQSTGAEIWQVTTEEFSQSNIYCEVPYCSGDSRYFVYQRRNPKLKRNDNEFMVVELGTWKQHRLDASWGGIRGCAISGDGVFYYLKKTKGDELALWRADLSKGVPEQVHRLEGSSRIGTLGTVSADGRHYACGVRLDDKYKMFGIMLIDLKASRRTIIDRGPDIFNAHPQFEPGQSKYLMIQHNRGGSFSPEGKLVQLVGPEGATLYSLSVPDGKRVPLQVGKPYTPPVTGHEAWIGTTGEVLLSVAPHGDYAPDKGNLLGVRMDKPARVVARGYAFNHVGVSRCGRFFCCDDWSPSCKLVIGSPRTGKTAVVCESKTSVSGAQNTHPHAYLTPNLKWVIFNSNRSGFPHIHAASVPEGMIEELSKT